MWKIEHPGGQREIDALHVPVGKTVRLVMASQDVIHSFFVPAFRIKHDVVPGTYETLWFKATETGEYQLECAQYCGIQHAPMIGEVFVMTPADYARWLADQGVAAVAGAAGRGIVPRSMAAAAATAPTAPSTRPRSTASTAASCIFRTARSCGPTSAISATASSSREPSPSPATRRSCRLFPARSARTN